MDPNVAWYSVLNGCKEAARNLKEWLDKGGFSPFNIPRNEVYSEIRKVLQ